MGREREGQRRQRVGLPEREAGGQDSNFIPYRLPALSGPKWRRGCTIRSTESRPHYLHEGCCTHACNSPPTRLVAGCNRPHPHTYPHIAGTLAWLATPVKTREDGGVGGDGMVEGSFTSAEKLLQDGLNSRTTIPRANQHREQASLQQN